MFSGNQKISGRQLQRVLVLDWVGKTSLLIPQFVQYSTGRDFLLSMLLGLFISFLYIALISWISKQVQNEFYDYIHLRMGKGSAVFICLVYLCYVFINMVYLLRLFGEIAKTFLLPEMDQGFFFVMLVAAGCYGAMGGLEAGARIGEVLYRILLIPLLFMILVSVQSVHPEYLVPGKAEFSFQTLQHGLWTFTVFGGAGLCLFVTPFLNEKSDGGKRIKKSIGIVVALAIGIVLIAIGSFGEMGVRASSWPLIALMSTVDIPGGFFQRWDSLFTGLLLCTFFVASTVGFYYLNLLTEKLIQRKPQKSWLFVSAVLVLAAAFFCGNYETAVRVYLFLNGYILVPLATLFICILAMVEWRRKRRNRYQCKKEN